MILYTNGGRDSKRTYGLINIGNKLMIAAPFITSIVNSMFRAIQSAFRPINGQNMKTEYLSKINEAYREVFQQIHDCWPYMRSA